MRNQILNFPEQLSQGIELAKGVKIDKTYEKVVVCGMGGSIIAGEILLLWQEVTGMQPTFYVHRDYDLPAWVSENDLVVCISWSGNTEETLSCYKTAITTSIPVVSITTGGKLAKLSGEHKTPLVLVPAESLTPRMGVGYMTAALFQLLGLGDNLSTFSLKMKDLEKIGEETAKSVENKTPLLYSSYKWRVIPRFWKVLFNENDKVHAFWNYFPAMAHNELAGFAKNPKVEFHPIFFKDSSDDPRQNKNIDTAIAILNKIGYNYSIVNISPASNPLEAVLNSYILGLWTTFYLAKKMVVDPEKTELVEEYKKLKSSK